MSTATWDDVEVKNEATGSGDWENPPEGAIPARVCALIDVGHHDATSQDGSQYQRRTVVLCYELAEKKKTGEPFIVGRTYTLSLAQNSSLYKIVKALAGEKKIGEAFDPSWVVGKFCLVQITHSTKTKKGKERTYANIDSIMAMPRGMRGPAGGCIVWSLRERKTVPLPDCSHLPSLYHESSGQMKRIYEWVNLSAEVTAEGSPVGAQAKTSSNGNGPKLEHPHARTATVQPMTQAEADAALAAEVPF